MIIIKHTNIFTMVFKNLLIVNEVHFFLEREGKAGEGQRKRERIFILFYLFGREREHEWG